MIDVCKMHSCAFERGSCPRRTRLGDGDFRFGQAGCREDLDLGMSPSERRQGASCLLRSTEQHRGPRRDDGHHGGISPVPQVGEEVRNLPRLFGRRCRPALSEVQVDQRRASAHTGLFVGRTDDGIERDARRLVVPELRERDAPDQASAIAARTPEERERT